MRKSVLTLERKYAPEVRYFRLWDPSTPTGARRLLCFKHPGPNGCQVRVSEAEYLAARPGEPSNLEIETMAGQR